MNRDPIRYLSGDANLYGYVGGMPVRSVDPEGLFGGWGGWGLPGGPELPRLDPDEQKRRDELYCFYLTPGNCAPADPPVLNWGSEAGFCTAAVALTIAGCKCIPSGGPDDGPDDWPDDWFDDPTQPDWTDEGINDPDHIFEGQPGWPGGPPSNPEPGDTFPGFGDGDTIPIN